MARRSKSSERVPLKRTFVAKPHPISLGRTFRILMRNSTTIWNGQHAMDQTLAAMQEMERYCAAHPQSPAAIRSPGSPFAAARLSRYWVQPSKRASLALATASKRRYAPLMCNTRALSLRLLTEIRIRRHRRMMWMARMRL